MRLPLVTNLKTRTGAPDKDAKLLNAYSESKGPTNDPNNPPQTMVRKRPIAQGGLAIGTGTAQGGIGLNINGTPYFIGFWADTMQTYTGNGTNWNSGTTYNIGDMVSVNFVDYWAINANTNSNPTSNPGNWSLTFIAPPPAKIYAKFDVNTSGRIVLSGGNLVLTISGVLNFFASLSASSVVNDYSKSAGKWYWEYTLTSYPSYSTIDFGIAIGTTIDSALSLGQNVNGMSYLSITNIWGKMASNVYLAYGAVLAQGDVVGIALDMDARTITFYKNGVSQGIAYSGFTAPVYAAIGGGNGNVTTTNTVITANFGASAFVYSPPAGFNSGLYV
jgi:hypothetical protein